jgi:hypothetical protein
MPAPSLLDPFLSLWPLLLLLVAVKVLARTFSSPSFKGWFGEMMVVRAGLRKLDPTRYRHFHDLYLRHPDGHGTTQIDHVVVSPFGIFVIETKNYRGWIFGSEKQREWTQQIYRKRSRFQNPLHQNRLHVRALMRFLGVPEDRFHSVVFFIGDADFKTAMPDNVLNRGLIPWIKQHTDPLLDADAWQIAAERLDELARATDRRSASRNHLAALETRLAR